VISTPEAGLSFEPLTPLAFLERSAVAHPDRTAVVEGDDRWTYAQFHDRCRRNAGLLAAAGVAPGDRVAVLAPNSHMMLESHFGVPYAGAVLVALNTRLSASEFRYIIKHSDAKVVLCAAELRTLAEEAAGSDPTRRVIDMDEYEQALASAQPTYLGVGDERSLMALNYTSGTTGRPKGVMYHHRGAYLQALAMVTHFGLTSEAVYLWTLPMFHCNGWSFTWAVTAVGGTHVCLPKVDPPRIWQLLGQEGVTHLCGAPTVFVSLVNDAAAAPITGRRVVVAVGGAPPAPALLERCAQLGFDVTHLYGLTETFGPVVICDWKPEWNRLTPAEQAVLRARQGIANIVSQRVRVLGPAGADVPADGATIGEIAVRGSNVMLGYYLDPLATAEACPDGWFRTGDLAVMHPDHYVEIRDRRKDVIISGGENISSVEVEAALVSHPSVREAAVVSMPDPKWGERPVAWVTLKSDQTATAEELQRHVRQRLAGFKVPDRIEFAELPKTASGKVQKFELRARVRAADPSQVS
jgi:fatty-acyl-CoA synthase